MIFRLSQALNARVKTGVLEALPLHDNPLLDWSAHLFLVGRSNFILISNTESLLSAVVSGQGVTSVDRFRERAFDGIRACLTALGYESLTQTVLADDNGPVRFAKSLNRSVSGSMNELVKCAEFCMSDGELTLPEVADRLNDTLLSALAAGGSHGYGKPREAFRVMVDGAVPNVPVVREEVGMMDTSNPRQIEIPDLKLRLKIAGERRRLAIAALAPKHKGGEWEEYHAANQEVLRLERLLATAQGEEYAEPCGFPLKWDAGAPMPHLMVNDHRALLAFLLSEPDPAWDGSYTTIQSPGSEQPEPLGLVEFDFCTSAKLGAPNDEVFEGHPLTGKGREPYAAQRVVNSRWLKELERINSVHPLYRPESWRDRTHFVFWFHDSTFECVARSYKVETHRTSMKELLALMVERVVS